jgi:threonine dehydratase
MEHSSDLHTRDILAARRRVAGIAAATALERSHALSALCGAEVYLKLECAQITGSFKLRGATNALLVERQAGNSACVACSAGNHALGLAYAAAHTGANLVVVLPATASPAKIAALRAIQAEAGADMLRVVLFGDSYDQAEAEALRIAQTEGRRFVSPYNHPGVIAGQGTLGIEILEQLPEAELLLVPVGGGGLISGVALWAKSVNPAIRVVGVQPAVSAVMAASLTAGRIVALPDAPSLADGLAGSIETDTITLALMKRLVDEVLLVSEQEIAGAMRWLLDEHHLVVEGSGAVGVAALLNGRLPAIAGRRVVTILSGRNVATATLLGAIQGQKQEAL